VQSIFSLLVLVAGAALAVQPAINATAALRMGHPLWAGVVSAAVSCLTLAAIIAALRLPPPSLGALRGFPPWLFCGGLIGAFMLMATLLAAPRLGVATTAAMVIAGQLAAALAVDQFGWFGMPQHPISGPRLLGGLFLFAGTLLIRA